MDRLTLQVLGPAMAEPDSRILRTSIRNLTGTATPGIAAGRLLLLLNEYFIWARRFTAQDIVQVENVGLLRAVVYLLGLRSEVREALTLSLGLRVAHELGWMASREIADVTLELAGLPSSAHWHRCLMQVENTVGSEWLSLFPKSREAEELIHDVRDILAGVLERHKKSPLQLQAPSATLLRNESFLATMLPEPRHGARFFVDWLKLMSGRWRLLEQDMTNVIKPDFPAAVNYGGAGRLIADEVLRGLYHDSLYNESPFGNHVSRKDYAQQTNGTSSTTENWSPHIVDSKALLASLAAYRLSAARHPSIAYPTESSLAQDRLFFVASCYALCSSANYVDVLYGDASHCCNEPVKTLPEFVAAFECAKPQPV
ncbi:hypothetical protein MRX96_052680 [Rhipicephalus microplus]